MCGAWTCICHAYFCTLLLGLATLQVLKKLAPCVKEVTRSGHALLGWNREHEQMEAAVHLEVAATLAERALWVQVLKVMPQHKEALERLARLWLRVGRWQRALEVADRAAAAHAANFASHALRGDVLMCARALPCVAASSRPVREPRSVAAVQLSHLCFLPCAHVLQDNATHFWSLDMCCIALRPCRAR